MGAVGTPATLSEVKVKGYQQLFRKQQRESDAFHEGYGRRRQGRAGGQVLHL